MGKEEKRLVIYSIKGLEYMAILYFSFRHYTIFKPLFKSGILIGLGN